MSKNVEGGQNKYLPCHARKCEKRNMYLEVFKMKKFKVTLKKVCNKI